MNASGIGHTLKGRILARDLTCRGVGRLCICFAKGVVIDKRRCEDTDNGVPGPVRADDLDLAVRQGEGKPYSPSLG